MTIIVFKDRVEMNLYKNDPDCKFNSDFHDTFKFIFTKEKAKEFADYIIKTLQVPL